MKLLKHGLAGAAFLVLNIFCMLPAIAQEATLFLPATPNGTALMAEGYFYDAMRARQKGDDKEAEKLFMEVLKRQPDAAAAYFELARIKFKQNNTEKATEYIQKAVQLQDSNTWYKAQYAEILALSNKFEQSADVFVALAKQEKYNEDYLKKAAAMYQHTGRMKDALAALNTILDRDPGNEEVLSLKQQLYLKMNDINGAVKVAQQMIDNNPLEGKYYAVLAEIYDNNKLPGNAVEVYRKMEKQFGDDPLVQLSLAEHYKKKDDLPRYNEYIRKVFANKGLDAEMKLALLGPYIMESGADTAKRKQAVILAAEVAALHADNAKVLDFYGDVLSLSNEQEKATEQYKRSLKIDPSNYKVWENLLFNYTDRAGVDSLIFYSEKALRLFPNQAMLHYLNGVGYSNKKNYPKAVKALHRAIDMLPEDNTTQLSQMYVAMGDAYHATKEYALSDSSYDKAMRYDPLNPTVLNNYSYYLSVRGVRLEDAERMSKKSLELRKDEPTFLDTYGWILYKQGKFQKAEEYVQKAIDSNPANADGALWEHLGDIQYKLGNTDKAVSSWIKAKEKGTENADIDKKIKDRKLYEA